MNITKIIYNNPKIKGLKMDFVDEIGSSKEVNNVLKLNDNISF